MQTTSSNLVMLCSLRGGLSPRTCPLWLINWLSHLTISNALFMPLPANEVTASQPVSACKLRRTRHTLEPSFSHSRGTLIKHNPFLVTLIKVSSAGVTDWWWHVNTLTCVFEETMVTVWCSCEDAYLWLMKEHPCISFLLVGILFLFFSCCHRSIYDDKLDAVVAMDNIYIKRLSILLAYSSFNHSL